jgi:hypothetical protein
MDTEKDPILAPKEMCEDANISMATWVRNYRHNPQLKIMRLSPRRIGARQSNWRKVLEQNVEAIGAFVLLFAWHVLPVILTAVA